MKASRLVGVVTLLLLLVASDAGAECAWIAWSWLVGMGDQYGINLPNERYAAYPVPPIGGRQRWDREA